MIVTKLTLQNFRNIEEACFVPAPALTVICGKNGQGKTNLLEGVWMLTGGKSFRGAKDAELIREGCGFSVLEGSVTGDKPAPRRETSVQTPTQESTGPPLDAPSPENHVSHDGAFASYEKKIRIAVAGESMPPKGRTARVNGVDYGRATNLAGILTAVVFDPNHLSLIKGSPEGRRKFIDAALCQLYPRYLSLLHRYTRTLTQKNALLKSLRGAYGAGGQINRDLLDVFDETLADCGTQISLRRRAYLEQLAPDAVQNYCDISNGGEVFALCYEPSFSGDSLLPALHESRARDLAAGFCTAGPHREDFTVTLSGRAAKSFGSQGQQRSAVLSLKLAEASAAQRVTGEHPVMLLDDVLSELDETRQSYLLNRMEDKQTIVTACDAGLFSRTNGTLYAMDGGRLKAL